MKYKSASAEELDKLFDSGSDELDDYLDMESVQRLNLVHRRVNVDFPQWMIAGLDREAKRRGITRQALIKVWISDRLDAAA